MTRHVLSKEAFDEIMFYAIMGIILGGRLGYVLFYKPGFYFAIRWRFSWSGMAACRFMAG